MRLSTANINHVFRLQRGCLLGVRWWDLDKCPRLQVLESLAVSIGSLNPSDRVIGMVFTEVVVLVVVPDADGQEIDVLAPTGPALSRVGWGTDLAWGPVRGQLIFFENGGWVGVGRGIEFVNMHTMC